MKFYVPLPGLNRMPGVAQDWHAKLAAPDYQRIAALADELGFGAITSSEHLALPRFEIPRLGPYWPHAMTVMSFLAGATTRIRVDASVIVLPYHHPVNIAKAVSTLDVLSGGRVTLSIGVGHAEKEFAALDVPFHERGQVANEQLELIKLLWTSDNVDFHGRYFNVEDVVFEPKPIQQPHPPIWVGGNSKAALRRAARNDGWIANPTTMTMELYSECLAYIKDQPEHQARKKPFDVSMALRGQGHEDLVVVPDAAAKGFKPMREPVLEKVEEFRDLGVTWTSISPPPLTEMSQFLDFLRWQAAEILPAFPD